MDNTESAEKAISTAGYSGITITYARNTSTLAAGDVFVSEWYDGTNWNTIESISSGFGGWTLISDAVLPAGAANNPNFIIRFRAASTAAHYCYVDAVSVRVDAGCVFDTVPPALPTGMTVLGGYGHISLDWKDNLETDLHHYKIYRNLTGSGTYTFIENADVSQYEDGNVSDGTTYYYVVTAVDASGNESAPSGQANARPCMTVADFDCNGHVDVNDLSYMASVWLTVDAKANISPSDNEVVNLEDMSVFAQQWLK
jgi:predicted phage tail protein